LRVYGETKAYPRIQAANPGMIDADGHIYVGQVIFIP
jgi:nucleoid-associated protein YgaU